MNSEDKSIDQWFEEAVKVVVQEQEANTSLLQRKFGIGYSKAAKLIEMLEATHVISEPIMTRRVNAKTVEEARALLSSSIAPGL